MKILTPFFGFLLFLIFAETTNAQQSLPYQEWINQKKYTDIIQHSVNLQASDSTDFATMYALGQAYEGLLKYKEAYHIYQYCHQLDSNQVTMLGTLGNMAAIIGKSQEAESYYQRLLKQDSTDFYANYQLGRLWMQQGQYNKANDRFRLLLSRDSLNSILLRNMGDCSIQMENKVEAIGYYSKAFLNNKENVVLASTIVHLLLQMQEPEKALVYCDTALKYNSTNRTLLQNKGLVLFTLKDYTASNQIFSTLLEEGDSTYSNFKYGGISRYYAGKYIESIDLLESAYAKDTTSVEVTLLLGSALGRTYDRKRAYDLFNKAENLIQPNPAIVSLLKQFKADTYGRDNRIAESAALYYELWLESENLNFLSQIWQLYRISKIKDHIDETHLQRCLFINVLTAKECLKKNKNKLLQHHARIQLELLLNDLFFRGVKTGLMLAPDNQKSEISFDQIQKLIKQLPENLPDQVQDDEDVE